MIINCFFLILHGLLVIFRGNSFPTQYVCEKYGFKLDWSFDRYCRAAHYRVRGLKEYIDHHLPVAFYKHIGHPNWVSGLINGTGR